MKIYWKKYQEVSPPQIHVSALRWALYKPPTLCKFVSWSREADLLPMLKYMFVTLLRKMNKNKSLMKCGFLSSCNWIVPGMFFSLLLCEFVNLPCELKSRQKFSLKIAEHGCSTEVHCGVIKKLFRLSTVSLLFVTVVETDLRLGDWWKA